MDYWSVEMMTSGIKGRLLVSRDKETGGMQSRLFLSRDIWTGGIQGRLMVSRNTYMDRWHTGQIIG